jgi:hypothetical protein
MHIALHRSAALSLALAAMLLRALLPDGWMPSANASGSLFTICSVEPAHRDGKAPQSEGHTHVPCAFAAASTLAPPSLVALAFGVTSTAWRVEAPTSRERPRLDRPHRTNIARGPPALA